MRTASTPSLESRGTFSPLSLSLPPLTTPPLPLPPVPYPLSLLSHTPSLIPLPPLSLPPLLPPLFHPIYSPVTTMIRYTYRLMRHSFGGLLFPAVSVLCSLRHFVANLLWSFEGGCVITLMLPLFGQVGSSRLRNHPIPSHR